MQEGFPQKKPKNNTLLIVLIIFVVLFLCCGGLIFFGGFVGMTAWRETKGLIHCSAAFQDLHEVVEQYALEHEGKLPPADRWQSELEPYYEARREEYSEMPLLQAMPKGQPWGCYDAKGKPESGIVYNIEVAEQTFETLPGDKVLFFEVPPPPQMNQSLPYTPPAQPAPTILGQKRKWLYITRDSTMPSDSFLGE